MEGFWAKCVWELSGKSDKSAIAVVGQCVRVLRCRDLTIFTKA